MAANIRDIAVQDIEAGERLRPVDDDYAAVLVESIEKLGLLQQLIVRPIRKVGKGSFELLAGAHRLNACKSLGWAHVPCMVLAACEDDNIALLTQIDENIARHDLNVLDRAVALIERKRIFEAINEEARHGGDRKSTKFNEKNQVANLATWSFSDETAKKTGLSARSIRRSIKLVKGLKPETRARLAGTDLADNQAVLTQISNMDAEHQHGVLDRMLRAEDRMGKVSDALADLEGRALGRERTASEKLMASLIHNWNRAGLKVRRDFIRLIKETDVGEIEFDPEGYGEAP